MTDPQLAVATDYGRMYSRERGGEAEVPSITTVLSTLNPNMGWWEALCAANKAYQRVEQLTEITKIANECHRAQKLRAELNWIKGAAERDRNAAAARGDLVHNYAEMYALYTLGQCSPTELHAAQQAADDAGWSDYLDSFHAFWWDYAPTVRQAEATVWNATRGYAGTTDLICDINGVPVIADYKTKRAVYYRGTPKQALRPETGMQLVAATHAEEVWVPGTAGAADAWVAWPYDVQIGLGVALGPDGYQVRTYDITQPLLWETFCALRRAWEFLRGGAEAMSAPLDGPDAIQHRHNGIAA